MVETVRYRGQAGLKNGALLWVGVGVPLGARVPPPLQSLLGERVEHF